MDQQTPIQGSTQDVVKDDKQKEASYKLPLEASTLEES